MGASKANEMLLLNHKLSAQEAHQIGFVAHVYRNESEVWDKLKQIDKLPMGSIVAGKKLIRAPIIDNMLKANNAEIAALKKLFESEEALEAIINFQMRRKSKL
jgi:peroxisomal 3,2-trans-enoyl-CoA isomerase